jgi:hypothetical protein
VTSWTGTSTGPRPGGCCARPATPTWPTRRRHHPRGSKLYVINPLLSQSTAVASASSTNPRESQPEGGRRFTSQSGQHQHETLGQIRPHPAGPNKSAVILHSG